MEIALQAAWANSLVFLHEALTKKLIQMLLELPGPIPSRLSNRSALKVHGKYSWSFLGKFLFVFLQNSY